MIRNLTLLTLTCFCWSASIAQVQSFSFYIVDEHTLQAIPFVSVFAAKTKTAFQSDKAGLVTLFDSNEQTSYNTYHLSYESEEVIPALAGDSIFLSLKAYELPTVDLNQISPLEVMVKAIKRIDKNYRQSSHYIEGTYFQIHKENQRYVRYIEAQASVEKMGYNTSIRLPQEEKFSIKKLRKSYNYEKNGDQHGDHFADLFAENPIQYAEKHFLNSSNLELYEWQFSNTTDDKFSITFQNKSWGSQHNVMGEIEINREDYGVKSITIIELPNDRAKFEQKSNWFFVNGWYVVNYKKLDGKYIIDKSTKWYHHLVKNEHNPSEVQYEVEEQFQWITDVYDAEKTNGKYSKLSNLYSLQMPYDSLAWESNQLLESAKSDLEIKHKLGYQFANP